MWTLHESVLKRLDDDRNIERLKESKYSVLTACYDCGKSFNKDIFFGRQQENISRIPPPPNVPYGNVAYVSANQEDGVLDSKRLRSSKSDIFRIILTVPFILGYNLGENGNILCDYLKAGTVFNIFTFFIAVADFCTTSSSKGTTSRIFPMA